MESLRIAQNEIKKENILVDYVLGKLIVRYINFDIGKIRSLTPKTTNEIGISRFTSFSSAPEIVCNSKNPQSLKENKYSPWKCQIYSLGILMLQLMGFFPTKMNSKDFDNYKSSEEEYTLFLTIFDDYSKNISDSFMKNILSVLRICLAYEPDNRLSANELLEILEDLEKNDEFIIEEQYNMIIKRRGSQTQKSNMTSNSNSKFFHRSKEEIQSKPMEDSEKEVQLLEENYILRNELNINKELLEEILIQQLNLIKLVKKDGNQIDNLKSLLNDEKETKLLVAKFNQEINLIFQELQEEIFSLKKMTNDTFGMNEVHSNYKVDKYEDRTTSCFADSGQLRFYEKENKECIFKLQDLKNKMKEENFFYPTEIDSFPELAVFLYEKLKNIEKDSNQAKLNFRENMQWEDNSLYTGQVDEKGIPQGVGILIYKIKEVKVICEFIEGKIKNDMGMLINKKNEYYFGKIRNLICQSIISTSKYYQSQIDLSYLEEIKGKLKQKIEKLLPQNHDSYEGETKEGIKEGKGKYIYRNGGYYEGYFKNNLREGKGEFVSAKGSYYEGEFKNDKEEGKGKFVHQDGSYYEGDWKNGMKE